MRHVKKAIRVVSGKASHQVKRVKIIFAHIAKNNSLLGEKIQCAKVATLPIVIFTAY